MAKNLSARQAAAREGTRVKVAMYLRVSRTGDRVLSDEKFRSPTLQRSAIERELDAVYGADRWELVDLPGNYDRGVWADFDVSGQSERRAGLDAAIDAIETHEVTTLGVLNISRWARGVLLGLRRIQEIEEKGAELISAEEQVEMQTPTGRFMTTQFLAVAQLYADQKADEWSRLIEQRAESGYHHGRLPVGFRRVTEGGDNDDDGEDEGKVGSGELLPVMVADPQTAPVVLDAFATFDAGASKTQVGRLLRDAGVVSATSQAVPVLSNRAYVRRHNTSCIGKGCERTDPHGPLGEVRQWELVPTTKGLRKKRRIGELWTPGRHDGIVDAELFDRVQARLAETAETGTRQRTAGHELTGVVRCAACGRVLGCDYGGSRVTMKCSSGKAAGCPGPGVVTADRILADVVIPALLALADTVGDAEAAARADAHRQHTERRRRPASTDPARLTAKHQRVLDRIAKIEVDRATGAYRGTDAEADTVITGLRATADQLMAELKDATTLEQPKSTPTGEVGSVVGDWDSMTVEQRNMALRRLLCVYVGRRSDGAPFRQPYAERCSVRWAWERD